MKIRMHKGGFDESMATCENIESSMAAISRYLYRYDSEVLRLVDLRVDLCSPKPDARNGWAETYSVSVKGYGGFNTVAFTDGPVSTKEPHDN